MLVVFSALLLPFVRAGDQPIIQAQDEVEYVNLLNKEIKNASGLSEEEYKKFQVTLRNLAKLGEFKYHGQILGHEPPKLLDDVDNELSRGSTHLFEGDILLTPDQMDDIILDAMEDAGVSPDAYDDLMAQEVKLPVQENPSGQTRWFKGRRRRRKRGNLDSKIRGSRKWSLPIRYSINTRTGVNANAVRAGIRLWESLTCIKFSQTTGAARNKLDFIRGSGCFSNVGSVGGTQSVSIGFGCTKLGIVAHEIGHALGFWHEQSRPDRDRYVKIVSGNVRAGTLGNFVKRRSSQAWLLGFPYDYGSVMHYGGTAFSTNRRPTIETIDPNYQQTIGDREGLSFYDVRNMNKVYCDNVCRSKLACRNGGYTDPKNCRRCRCPHGLSGTTCTSAAPGSSRCGQGTLTSSGSWKTITMRGSGQCNWFIKAPSGRRVMIQVQRMTFQTGIVSCRSAFLEVKTASDLANTGAKLCTRRPTNTMTSAGTQALVLYRGLGSSSVTFRYRHDPPTGRLTPAPRTPAPRTIAPRTPAPRTPAPRTPRPRTPAPRTPRPRTPAPRTPAPRTLRPWTPAPTRGWAPWSSWSSCSRSCGGCGAQVRRRRCAGGTCPGAPTQSRGCDFAPCPGSQKCCAPYYLRNNQWCDVVKGNRIATPRPVVTSRPNPAGVWSQWSSWGNCAGKQCGGCGSQTRTRFCSRLPCSPSAIKQPLQSTGSTKPTEIPSQAASDQRSDSKHNPDKQTVTFDPATGSTSSQSQKVTCYKCGQRGHYARDCQTKKINMIGATPPDDGNQEGSTPVSKPEGSDALYYTLDGPHIEYDGEARSSDSD